MSNPHILEIFSDYTWPWCYFITGRIEQLKNEFEITVRWRAFPLHPDTPKEGRLLKDLFANQPVDIEKMMDQLQKTASDLGLAFGKREKTYNSRLAQELGLWAESMHKGDEFHEAVFKAYFVDGSNIAETSILLDLAASVGLSVQEASAVLLNRTFKDAVDADWSLSKEKAITVVPALLFNQNRLAGAQTYDAMVNMLESNHVARKKGHWHIHFTAALLLGYHSQAQNSCPAWNIRVYTWNIRVYNK
jgi:predicted DsbA family dithiol-disulfide isomerase